MKTRKEMIRDIPLRLATVVAGKHTGKKVQVLMVDNGLCCADLGSSGKNKLVIIREIDLQYWQSVRSVEIKADGTKIVEPL